jgi:hypothetical protein
MEEQEEQEGSDAEHDTDGVASSVLGMLGGMWSGGSGAHSGSSVAAKGKVKAKNKVNPARQPNQSLVQSSPSSRQQQQSQSSGLPTEGGQGKSEVQCAKEWHQMDKRQKVETVTTAREWLESDALSNKEYVAIAEKIMNLETIMAQAPFSGACLSFEDAQALKPKVDGLKKQFRTAHSTLVAFTVKISKRKGIPAQVTLFLMRRRESLKSVQAVLSLLTDKDKDVDLTMLESHHEITTDFFELPVAVAVKHRIAKIVEFMRVGTSEELESLIKDASLLDNAVASESDIHAANKKAIELGLSKIATGATADVATTVQSLSKISDICWSSSVDNIEATDIEDLNTLSITVTSTAELSRREDGMASLLKLEGDSNYNGVLKSLFFSAHWKLIKKHLNKDFEKGKKGLGPLHLLSQCASILADELNSGKPMEPSEVLALEKQFSTAMKFIADQECPRKEMQALEALMNTELEISQQCLQSINEECTVLFHALASRENTDEPRLSKVQQGVKGRLAKTTYFVGQVRLHLRSSISTELGKVLDELEQLNKHICINMPRYLDKCKQVPGAMDAGDVQKTVALFRELTRLREQFNYGLEQDAIEALATLCSEKGITGAASASYQELRPKWSALVLESVNKGFAFDFGQSDKPAFQLRREFDTATYQVKQLCAYSPTAADDEANITYGEHLHIVATSFAPTDIWMNVDIHADVAERLQAAVLNNATLKHFYASVGGLLELGEESFTKRLPWLAGSIPADKVWQKLQESNTMVADFIDKLISQIEQFLSKKIGALDGLLKAFDPNKADEKATKALKSAAEKVEDMFKDLSSVLTDLGVDMQEPEANRLSAPHKEWLTLVAGLLDTFTLKVCQWGLSTLCNDSRAASWPKGKEIRETLWNVSEKYAAQVPKLSEPLRTKLEELLKLRRDGPSTEATADMKPGDDEQIPAEESEAVDADAQETERVPGKQKRRLKRKQGSDTPAQEAGEAAGEEQNMSLPSAKRSRSRPQAQGGKQPKPQGGKQPKRPNLAMKTAVKAKPGIVRVGKLAMKTRRRRESIAALASDAKDAD